MKIKIYHYEKQNIQLFNMEDSSKRGNGRGKKVSRNKFWVEFFPY